MVEFCATAAELFVNISLTLTICYCADGIMTFVTILSHHNNPFSICDRKKAVFFLYIVFYIF